MSSTACCTCAATTITRTRAAPPCACASATTWPCSGCPTSPPRKTNKLLQGIVVNATLTALVCLLPAAPPADSLEVRLLPLAKAHKGKVAIAVKHLVSGESFYHNA